MDKNYLFTLPRLDRDGRVLSHREPSFSIRPSRLPLRQGDQVSIDFDDGKGVSARVAYVSIAAGGTPFSIVCTDDGEWVSSGPLTCPEPDSNPLRDMIATVQDAGYIVQEAEDYQAGLRIEYERGKADARPESVCNEANGETRTDVPEREPRELTGELTRLRMELELSRERAQAALARWHASSNRIDGLLRGLSEARDERDEYHSRALTAEEEIRALRNERERLHAELKSLHEQGRTVVIYNVPEGVSLTLQAGE